MDSISRALLMVSGGAAAPAGLYVEDVFSTYLYGGTSSSQTITNQINLADSGGLVWIKARNSAVDHFLTDTNRGASRVLYTNSTAREQNYGASGVSAFNNNGFSLNGFGNEYNASSLNYCSWTFRKAPKFFDVVTYAGNSVAGRQISHNLGSEPGMVIIKNTTSSGSSWYVYHRSLGFGFSSGLLLNSSGVGEIPAISAASATTFTPFTNSTAWNQTGENYVAYLFAHDPAADGIIQCGTFNTDASYNATVNLGWEPQWLLIKDVTGPIEWNIYDNMRGLSLNSFSTLKPNTVGTEFMSTGGALFPTATGFVNTNANSQSPLAASRTHIYVAIRRPMKTPTTGTSVFNSNISTAYDETNITNFPIDAQIWSVRGGIARNSIVVDRMRGVGTGGSTNDGSFVSTALTDAEIGAGNNTSRSWNNVGFNTPGYAGSVPEVFWSFRRAPGFFDIATYKGNGGTVTVNHNLGTAAKLIIIKRTDAVGDWGVYFTQVDPAVEAALLLNSNAAKYSSAIAFTSSTTFFRVFGSSNFPMDNSINNASYVAYLFGSLAGVSKVGAYTGNGSSQTINCAFAAGARFVMIKRTDSTGNWYIWDTTRGIITGNDPHLSLNTTAAEVTTNDSVDPNSTGFIVNQVSATNINVTSATYIYLAIA
jgi:hypothetical protein